MTGIVITTLSHRGFSFIADDETREEIFAHSSDYPSGKIFPKNTKVSFDLADWRGKQKAVNIQKMDEKPTPHAQRTLNPRSTHAAPSKDVTGGRQ